jgi:hypothetical protein
MNLPAINPLCDNSENTCESTAITYYLISDVVIEEAGIRCLMQRQRDRLRIFLVRDESNLVVSHLWMTQCSQLDNGIPSQVFPACILSI